LSVKADEYNDLSFSVSLDVFKNFELFAEGSNLLDESLRNFNTYRNVPAFYEENGRSFFFGIRGRI
jgi:iron complex outermembrane recepter protein